MSFRLSAIGVLLFRLDKWKSIDLYGISSFMQFHRFFFTSEPPTGIME